MTTIAKQPDWSEGEIEAMLAAVAMLGEGQETWEAVGSALGRGPVFVLMEYTRIGGKRRLEEYKRQQAQPPAAASADSPQPEPISASASASFSTEALDLPDDGRREAGDSPRHPHAAIDRAVLAPPSPGPPAKRNAVQELSQPEPKSNSRSSQDHSAPPPTSKRPRTSLVSGSWSASEDELLLRLTKHSALDSDWREIAKNFKHKKALSCESRWKELNREAVGHRKKDASSGEGWNDERDARLHELVAMYAGPLQPSDWKRITFHFNWTNAFGVRNRWLATGGDKRLKGPDLTPPPASPEPEPGPPPMELQPATLAIIQKAHNAGLKSMHGEPWTDVEDHALQLLVRQFELNRRALDWDTIAGLLDTGRHSVPCAGRWSYLSNYTVLPLAEEEAVASLRKTQRNLAPKPDTPPPQKKMRPLKPSPGI